MVNAHMANILRLTYFIVQCCRNPSPSNGHNMLRSSLSLLGWAAEIRFEEPENMTKCEQILSLN